MYLSVIFASNPNGKIVLTFLLVAHNLVVHSGILRSKGFYLEMGLSLFKHSVLIMSNQIYKLMRLEYFTIQQNQYIFNFVMAWLRKDDEKKEENYRYIFSGSEDDRLRY